MIPPHLLDDGTRSNVGKYVDDWTDENDLCYDIDGLTKFINYKGFKPRGYNTDEPDLNDLWDIIDENGWSRTFDPEDQTETVGEEFYVYNERGLLHNSRGVAHYTVDPASGDIMYEYYINGILHRTNGPAVVSLEADGSVLNEEYWELGVFDDTK
jgi:hypothetical protein